MSLTWNTVRYINGKAYREGEYLSTDSKPVTADMMNGSKLIVMDTSKLFLYDAANATWREWGAEVTE